jgi:hypothetical protein
MKATLTFLSLMILPSLALAADPPLSWPQFRGPGGSGVADNQKPPTEVGPETNVLWKVETPPGASSPIIVGDMLVMTAFENNKLYTIAYSRANGKELWRAHAPHRRPMASTSSPTSAPAACSATTAPARSCGNIPCRWPSPWPTSVQGLRPFSPMVSSSWCAMN